MILKQKCKNNLCLMFHGAVKCFMAAFFIFGLATVFAAGLTKCASPSMADETASTDKEME